MKSYSRSIRASVATELFSLMSYFVLFNEQIGEDLGYAKKKTLGIWLQKLHWWKSYAAIFRIFHMKIFIF